MTSTNHNDKNDTSPNFKSIMDKQERAIIKAQRNLTLKWYSKSYEEMTDYQKIKERYLGEWRELMKKPRPHDPIWVYEQKVIESKAHLYETRISGIVDKLHQWNQELSYKILDYNVMLGFEEDDLYSTHGGDDDTEIHKWLEEVEDEDGEIPSFQEQLNQWAEEEKQPCDE